ncbi:MAG: isoprenylcysteine carboxylmethyltransferase family protein [Pirellulaceae bacterium]
MLRGLGIAFGVVTHLIFAFTVWHLFFFLRGGRETGPANVPWNLALATDALLALQFAVPHSLLLWPPTRSFLTRWIPSELYGCVYCIVTCTSLLLLFSWWQPCPGSFWHCDGALSGVAQACFYGSWVSLFYSLHLTGLGYQTGLTPWWYWVRRQRAPRRAFCSHGLYRWLRHPVYLSFLGLIWFTPHMTADRAVLTTLWTIYIFVGSYFKDERLAYYLGDTYRQYQQRVPGYPLLNFGPLGRLHERTPREV